MSMNFATSLTGGVSVHLKMAVPSFTSSNRCIVVDKKELFGHEILNQHFVLGWQLRGSKNILRLANIEPGEQTNQTAFLVYYGKPGRTYFFKCLDCGRNRKICG